MPDNGAKERVGDFRDHWVWLVAAFTASSSFADCWGCKHRCKGP